MALDIQGVVYNLCEPEIATTNLTDNDSTILFFCGNLSTKAIEKFCQDHICDKFCMPLNFET